MEHYGGDAGHDPKCVSRKQGGKKYNVADASGLHSDTHRDLDHKYPRESDKKEKSRENSTQRSRRVSFDLSEESLRDASRLDQSAYDQLNGGQFTGFSSESPVRSRSQQSRKGLNG